MGKGDKKSRRGKIALGTYGVRRKRSKKTTNAGPAAPKKAAAKKEAPAKKTAAAKKESAPAKKAPAKKAAAKKSE